MSLRICMRSCFLILNPRIVVVPKILLLAFCFLPACLFAQGGLTPPGAPAPTFKTLQQVEPRTPISSLPYTISSPGSYYVTTNLTGVNAASGITIAANDVTLDLKGFSLVGVPGSIDGILVSGNRTNLWIGNGTIRGWGLEGIDGTTAQSSVFMDLKIIGGGDVGLRSGTAATVTRCTALANNQEGILAFDNCQFSQCAARNNGASGIVAGNNSRITDCQAQFNNSDGIAAGAGCSISGCTSANNTNSAGISTGSGCLISHCAAANNYNGILAGADSSISVCTARANLNFGISLSSNSVVTACAASGNAYIGIAIQGANSTAKACVASSNATGGLILFGRYSTVEGCTASGNLFVGIQFNADGCLALNNTCDSNGTGFTGNAGIACFGISGSRIEANHFSNNNHRGLYLDSGSTRSIITRNIVVTNTVQTISYDVNTANNDVGPIGRAVTATSPWANLQY
jgi:parallel beta-helix repeat protein